MNIAAEMMSIFEAVSAGISVENCIGSTSTVKPASLPTALMRSTMTPWIVLVLVSRKVKGTPVGVAPTFSGWAPTRRVRSSPRSSADDRHRLANRLLIDAAPVQARSRAAVTAACFHHREEYRMFMRVDARRFHVHEDRARSRMAWR